MTNRSFVLSAAVLACTFGGVAVADTVLISPPIFEQNLDTVWCSVVNLSEKSRTMKGELLDGHNNVLDEFDDLISPGETDLALVTVSRVGPIYCRITTDGKRKEVRASLQVVNGGQTLAIVPLQ